MRVSGGRPVSLVVTRDDVQQHEVAAPVRNVAEADPHSREHPSGIFIIDKSRISTACEIIERADILTK